MAEETKAEPAAPAEAVVEEPEKKEVEAPVEEKKEEAATVEEEKKEEAAAEEAVGESGSFQEESSRVSDLADPEKKALEEFKQLIQEALTKHEFTAPPPPPAKVEEAEKPKESEEPKSEEPKLEEPTPEEETKAEEPKPEEPKPEEAKPEEPKPEEPKPEEPKPEESKPEEPAAEVVEEKTVEAIAETVVEVAAAEPAAESSEPAAEEDKKEEPAPPAPEPEEVEIFGVPLLGDEKSDVVLLKFLRARDFKVKEAMTMLKNTVRWRKEFGIEALLVEDFGHDLDAVVFTHGFDREGHPVCYNVYGEFQNKELCDKAFSDAEKRQKFLRWRIQFLEKSIRDQLDFSPGGISTIVQVTDLKNSPGPAKRELRQTTNQALHMLQDNYPEFVAKQVFINVPWWYLAFNRMISPFLTQRTKSKFVFAGPSKSTETLFRYIAPEHVPIQYGGLSNPCETDFTTADPVTDVTIKPTSKYTIELPATEACVLVWELRVPGWDVSYCAEFVPNAEDGYTIIVSKTRKLSPTDEPVIKNNFKIGEPGKVVLTIDNTSSKKKKLLYRSKTKSSLE